MFRKITRLTRTYLLEKKISDLLSNKSRKIHIGCGTDLLDGYINIDSSPDVGADLVLDVSKFNHFPDECVELIESYHFIEHLDYYLALRTLQHFYRMLVPGGMVLMELPDLDVCIRSIGKYTEHNGIDLAMCGIYGHPPAIKRDGISQVHKWGWTFNTLAKELSEIGFINIRRQDIRQTYREATVFDRDMQVRAVKPDKTP